jgi:glycosyltransferase involved in cell wall biosynthesis
MRRLKELCIMSLPESLRVGFVVRRYPRYSETFIVREILAHERAGLAVEIFSLRPPIDRHFQDLIGRVRAPVTYLCLPAEGVVAEQLAAATLTISYFWQALAEASAVLPGLWGALEEARYEEARNVYQAVLLAREVRLKGIDHLHATFANETATVARHAARFAGISYSLTARAKDIFHDNVQAEDLRRKLQGATGVVTVSDYHCEYLRRTYGSAAARVQRIYNGLDLDDFPYQAPADRPPLILAVGRLVEKKGFEDLIDACAILAGPARPLRCRLVGSGVLQGTLLTRIERLGLKDRVELVGPRPQSEVIREVQQAAVLAAPCIIGKDGDRDGLPNVIQEALALGTPVVSTDVTGIPEVVRDGETGLIVPQHDPPALAAAIERLLGDPNLRVRLAACGRRLIEDEFNIHCNTVRRRAIFLTSSAGSAEPLREAS